MVLFFIIDEKKIASEKWLQAWLEMKLKLLRQSISKYILSWIIAVLHGRGLWTHGLIIPELKKSANATVIIAPKIT